MSRPKKIRLRPEVGTFYPLDQVRREIVHVLDDLIGKGDPRSGVRKRAAAAIGMTESELSKHINARKSETFFHVEEIGRLADFVEKEYATPPPGWPFVTFKAFDDFREIAARLAHPKT